MAWAKGVSPNPSGRPTNEELAPVVQNARLHTQAAIDTLVACLKSASDRTKVAAAIALLDRGWGAPKQEIGFNDRRPFTAATDADLWALIAAGRRSTAPPEGDSDEPGGLVH